MKNINLFFHSKEDKFFSAFASDLGHGIFEKFGNGRMGVVVFNNKTDKHVDFEVVKECFQDVSGGDRELYCWNLKPTEYSVRFNPRLSGYTMRIFND